MTRAFMFLLTLLLAPAIAFAQKPIVEIGTNLGVTTQSSGGITVTRFGVPGQGLLGQPTIYASFFTGDAFLVEPQVAFNFLSIDGETATTVGLGGQFGYLLKGSETNSLMVACNLGYQSTSAGGSSNNDFAAGGKVGYRIPVGTGFALRVEGGYRRWFDSEVNEFSVGIGIGGLIRSKQ